MSRLLFTKYWMLVHLLVSAGILCFFAPSAMGCGLWCATSLLLVMFTVPPIYKGESFWSARERVKHAFCKEPLFWAGLPALFFLLAQLFNPRGTELIGSYDPILKKTLWDYAPAKATWLPSSFEPFAEGSTGSLFFVAFLVSLTCAIVIRCALPRKQRLLLLIGLTVLSGLYGFFFTCFGEACLPAMGDVERSLLFILMLCVSLGITMEHFLEHRLTLAMWGLGGAVLNGFSLMAIGSPWMATFGALVILGYIGFTISMVMGKGRGKRFVWAVILILPMFLGPGLGLAVTKKTGPWSIMTRPAVRSEAVETAFEQWSFRTELASALAKDHLVAGQGPGAFDRLAPMRLKGKKAWTQWRADKGLPSDLFTFILEQGYLGLLLIFLPFGVLLVQALMTLVDYCQHRHHAYSVRYIFIAITSTVGLLATFALMTFATPLHTPGMLCAVLMVFATLQGWLPRKRM